MVKSDLQKKEITFQWQRKVCCARFASVGGCGMNSVDRYLPHVYYTFTEGASVLSRSTPAYYCALYDRRLRLL